MIVKSNADRPEQPAARTETAPSQASGADKALSPGLVMNADRGAKPKTADLAALKDTLFLRLGGRKPPARGARSVAAWRLQVGCASVGHCRSPARLRLDRPPAPAPKAARRTFRISSGVKALQVAHSGRRASIAARAASKSTCRGSALPASSRRAGIAGRRVGAWKYVVPCQNNS